MSMIMALVIYFTGILLFSYPQWILFRSGRIHGWSLTLVFGILACLIIQVIVMGNLYAYLLTVVTK